MKKTFRTLLAGALALCAVACYDDSALQEDLAGVKEDLSALQAEFETFKNKLNGEVAALQSTYTALNGSFTEYKGLNDAQVTALNTALNNLKGQLGSDNNSGILGQIATINSLLTANGIDAESNLKAALTDLATKLDLKADEATLAALAETVQSITVRSVSETDGKIVITLANNETLTIDKDGEGVVKVVDDNWVVVGADGTETDLELPVSTPNLQFNVNWRNGELSYTTVENPTEDDWTFTGISVSGVNEGSSYIVLTDVDIWESDEYIKVRIDGDWYNLPIVAEGGSDAGVGATLEILAGKTIVPVGSEKTLELNADGLSDVYVMSKPDGWKAVINGNKLTVTAPVEGNPYAEQEGLVLLHGTTEAGQCVVAKLAVTTSTAGLEIIVDDETGKVTVKNGIVTTASANSGIGGIEPLSLDDEVSGEVDATYSFAPFWFGFATSDILAEADGKIENLIKWQQIFQSSSFFESGTYSSDYTVDVLETSVQELYQRWFMEEMPEGTQMVLFATPADLDSPTQGPVVDDLVFDWYNPLFVSIKEVSKSYNDVSLSVTRAGADYYYIGFGEYTANAEDRLYSFFNNWQMGYGELGTKVYDTTNESVRLSEYCLEDAEWSPLKPSTTYYAFAFPVTAGMSLSDLDFDIDFLPCLKTFTTADLTEGGNGTVTITKNEEGTGYYSIAADLQVSGTAEVLFYHFFDADPSEEDEATLVSEIIAEGNMAEATGTVSALLNRNLAPGVKRYLAAIAVDSEGNYGEIAIAELSADSFPTDEAIQVTVKSVSIEGAKATVTYGVTGADRLAVYANYDGTEPQVNSSNASVNSFLSNVLTYATPYYYAYVDVVDGEAIVEYTNYSSYYKWAYATGVVFVDGKASKVSSVTPVDLSTWTAGE